MRFWPTVLALAVLGILCISAGYAGDPAVPGGIKLLPGYAHQKLKGIDSRVGRISKNGGVRFQYDLGGLGWGNLVNNVLKDKDNLLWSREQVIDGRIVQLAMTKDRTLNVTFPETRANFYGTARSEEDVADMLLMVLSYAPAKAK
jgi:hypothetical protein